MRGKRRFSRSTRRDGRIIPAHAGQTVCGACSTSVATDHPRACGANGKISSKTMVRTGSSPRMRGKPMQTADKVDEHRIIPAHAGQTARPCTSSADLTDHPRACGANSVIAIDAMVVPGSSPRMRGKLKQLSDLIDHRWIIPAHAGQTYRYGCGRHRQPDHPRACGANPVRTVPSLWASGSSPRMRGKQRAFIENTLKPRIIPAHAGQTDVARWSGNWRTDHPRACGANSRLLQAATTSLGSSPRMRGKQRLTSIEHFAERIIPAHAGQTAVPTVADGTRSDHPRACGANMRWPARPGV